jgi:hypothetical protein
LLQSPVLEQKFVTTKSGVPSPLTSAIATESALIPPEL